MNRSAIQRVFNEWYPDVEANDPVAYVGEVGYAVDALLYGYLFWPQLAEIEGAVFLALHGGDEAEISQRLSSLTADEQVRRSAMSWVQVVNSFNIFEVEYLFRNWRGASDRYEDVHRELGSMLLEPWRARLASAYPQRRFSVRLLDPDDSMGWRVTVSQESPMLVAPQPWEARHGV
jgi:hypothetical protein